MLANSSLVKPFLACWMLSAGENPAFIATQMGHSSAKMAQNIYNA
ncbi:hypothetical protein ACTXA3_18090 [Proteus mirabilis]